MPKIMYPPNMVYQRQFYPDLPHGMSRPTRGEIATPRAVNDPLINAEPPSQIMPNRISMKEQPHLSNRGNAAAKISVCDIPSQECPVCGHDFPLNLSETAKAEHVNKHFEE